MEVQGRLIYFDGDENLNQIVSGLRRDIVPFAYKHTKTWSTERRYLSENKKAEVPLKIFGEHNLQNMEAARLACRQIEWPINSFIRLSRIFWGLQPSCRKIVETENAVAFKDFAFAIKLKATVNAVKRSLPIAVVDSLYGVAYF